MGGFQQINGSSLIGLGWNQMTFLALGLVGAKVLIFTEASGHSRQGIGRTQVGRKPAAEITQDS